MKTIKKKLISLTMVFALLSNIFVMPNSFATEVSALSENTDASFKARVEGENPRKLIIYSDENKQDFFNKVVSVKINEDTYEQDSSEKSFTIGSNKIEIPNFVKKENEFKYNEIRLITQSEGYKEFVFMNEEPSAIYMNEALEILEPIKAIAGEEVEIDGKLYGTTAEEVRIPLEYDIYDSEGRSQLYNLFQNITEIKIDGMSYPLRDDAGARNFILFRDAISTYDKYDVGKAIVDDFKKRAYHKVEITFKDGSAKQYVHPQYEEPKRDSNEYTQDEKELRKTVKAYLLKKDRSGLSKVNEIFESNVQIEKIDKMVGPFAGARIRLDFRPMTIQGQSIIVDSASIYASAMDRTIEGKKVDGTQTSFLFELPRFVVDKSENEEQDDEYEITFTTNPNVHTEPQKAILLFDWNGNYVPPVQTPIAEKYLAQEIKVEEKYGVNQLVLKTNPVFSRKDKSDMESLLIGNVEYPISDDFSIEMPEGILVTRSGVIVSKANENDPIVATLKFKDNSRLNFSSPKNVTKPPVEEKIASKYTITKTEIVYDSLVVGMTPRLEHKENITHIEVNGEKFVAPQDEMAWKSFRDALQVENYGRGQQLITKAKEANPIVVKLYFDDDSILSQVVENNNNSDEVVNNSGIGSNYSITNVGVNEYDDLLISITPSFTHTDAITHITVNGEEFEAPSSVMAWKRWKNALEIPNSGDGERIVRKAKTQQNISIIIKFNDGSVLKNTVENSTTPVPVQPEQKYTITYIFKSNNGKDLPSSVTWRVPSEETEKSNGYIPTLEQNFSSVRAQVDGVFGEWRFKNWNKEAEAVNNSNQTYEGIWEFVEVPTYKIIYQFVGDVPSGEVVPNEIVGKYSGDGVNRQSDKEIKTLQGKYSLVWDKSKTKVENENVIVVGTWTYTKYPTTPPENGIADKFTITESKISQRWNGEDQLELSISPKLDYADGKKVASIIVNGTEFLPNTTLYSSWDGKVEITETEIVNKAKEKTPIGVIIRFEDGSIIKKDAEYTPEPTKYKIIFEFMGDVPSGEVAPEQILDKISGDTIEIPQDREVETPNGKYKLVWDRSITTITDNDVKIVGRWTFTPKENLTLNSNLKDGEYTLTYKAYVKNTNQQEESTLAKFFDKRAKLVVENGIKKVTFLNHSYAEIILDFAIKNINYESAIKNVLTQAKNGDPTNVEYTVTLDNLQGVKEFATLGNGVMGGSSSDKGNYESPNYKFIDIVFEDEIVEGFNDFEINEKAKEQKAKNKEILVDALISHGVDTNSDGEISEEELRNATGSNKTVAGEMRSNVIDLEGLGITDISMLKDLGPNIKVLNLNANKIEKLPENLFANAKGLEYLYLGANNISEIDVTTFEGATNLKYLDLDSNNLETLPNNIFEKNTKLQVLTISNSELTTLPNNLIHNLTKLKSLYLYENKLKNLSDDFFEGKHIVLTEIHLNHNKLENIPSSIGNLSNVKDIRLNNNNIKNLPQSFENLKHITNLDLSHNQIESIPTNVFFNLLKKSKTAFGVVVNLKDNNLSSLPLDEMISYIDTNGKKISGLNVSLNNLDLEISNEEKEKLENVGVRFGNSTEVYGPQKTSIKPEVVAENGKIKLTQQFDLLEIYYWDLGDPVRYGGKNSFVTDKEFENYLLGQGRDQNRVSRDIPRDEAVKNILEKRSIQWKVETIITKNGGNVIYNNLSEINEKEGQLQEFVDSNMNENDSYVLTKILYVKDVYGWSQFVRYSKSFTAKNTIKLEDEKEISVRAVRIGTNDDSVMNKALNPIAKLVEKDGKFIYSVDLKPITMGQITAGVDKLNVFIDGEKIVASVKDSEGEYNKTYTFESNKKLDRVKVSMKVSAMGSYEPEAELIFEDNTSNETQEEIANIIKNVKGYILTSDKKKMSMANKSLVNDIEIRETNEKIGDVELVEFKIKFNEMSIGNVSAGVENLFLELNGEIKEATKVSGEKGSFTFKAPKFIVKENSENKDTEIKIEVETYPKVAGHNSRQGAILVLDWNKDFKEIKNDVPSSPATSGGGVSNSKESFTIPVWLKNKNTGEKSVGNAALIQTAKIERNGNKYKYKVTFDSVTLPVGNQNMRGTVTEFNVFINGVEQTIVGNPVSNGIEYEFELDNKVSEQLVSIVVDVMAAMGMGRTQAILVFDWDGTNSLPSSQGGSIVNSSSLTQNKLTNEEIEKRANTILENKEFYRKSTIEKIEKAISDLKINSINAKDKLENLVKEARVERVQDTLSKGYINGYENNKFMPNKTITKAEIAKIFENTMQSSAQKIYAKDINEKAYYAKGIQTLLQNNIIELYPDNTIVPNEEMTRLDLAIIIAKILELKLETREFKDMDKNHWAIGYIGALVNNNIITGYKDNTFKPEQKITRAEAIAMINRAFKITNTQKTKKEFEDVKQNHWAYKDIVAASF